MVKGAKKMITATLLGMISLQMIMPLLLLLAISLAKESQRESIAINEYSGRLCAEIRINENDSRLHFTDADEFIYNGVLYDAQSIKKGNGQYIIRAIADKKETQLQQVNAAQFEQSNNPATENFKIIPFFFLFFQRPAVWLPR